MSIELLNAVDKVAHIRNALRRVASERNDYAGCPLPIEGLGLTIEPTFKYQGLSDVCQQEEKQGPVTYKIRNSFWSHKLKCRIAICEDLITHEIYAAHFEGSGNQIESVLNTIHASNAWGLEQEQKALMTLGELLRHHTFKAYLLTGSFIESSVQSGVTYIFRKLRPTIAIKSDINGKMKVLCTLCMHPIGYYDHSWAGCMTPTDDVIAHLLMMRADEHMFWKRCNQHAPHHPESGI